MFHYHYMPTGPVFELARPYLTMSKVDLATTTAPFGDRPVTHFAHQADLVRLAMLEQYGGIYLDLDVIVMASMDHLLDHEFIMGQEGIDGSVGLCNAVILARPHARFLQRWQQTYRTFDQSDWNYHSVVLPGKLAPAFPHEITIMNHTTFFWPLWDSPGLRTLFLEKSYTFDDNLATHIWESAANPHLMTGLEPDVIRHVDNSLYCQLRLLLSPDDEQPIRPCRILTHSNRSDQLVGHWSLAPPSDPTLLRINPTPAQDDSGNDMHGIIRNGYFNTPNDGVYVSGQDSYIFLSMPTQLTVSNLTIQWQMKRTDDLIKNGTVLMVQMDECKLIIKPNTIETWILMDWTWELASSVLTINNNNNNNDDDQYHLYTLVIRHDGSLLLPDLVVYKDGYVWASQVSWQYTSIVRGLWFGSAEPNKYQDPWDTTLSLAAWYKDIKVWERALVLHDIRTDAFKNANIQSWPPLNVD
ncbi:hypothetical protein BC941DRAFT_351210 [Chlamydoabsidia padenii]|nr:hypothetical protein BC941DRAFT_351210 [Chlamydoabsidia padenii]